MLPINITHTYDALIPKKKQLEVVVDYRPISLCNVLYKIISKVLANHFKVILPQFVSSTNSDFMLSRLITNNVLIVYEILHIETEMWRKRSLMSIKLDISKAYDRVE